jgi:hypothetical protein
MSANSTLLASLTLQVQDNENSGQTIVNRQVPQFSFQAVQSPYASYVTVQPGASAIVLVASPLLAHFFYVRNATTPTTILSQYILQVGWQDSLFVVTNAVALVPGGLIMLGNQNINNSSGSFTQLNISAPTNDNPVVAEFLYAT